ncbi:hypothetical protein V2J09_014203 [Rumex salicifolius]
MAMAFTTQATLLAKPIVGHSKAPSHLVCGFVPRVHRKSSFQVSCMSEDKKNIAPQEQQPQSSIPTPTSIPTPPPKPKVSTKFGDVLAFSGPAPERINGRLAMIGFVAAMGVELAKGSDLFAQISDGGVQWFVVTSLVLSFASLIPLFKGVTVESKSGGFMSSDAELWNGRIAMLGLVALAFTEFVKGGALV